MIHLECTKDEFMGRINKIISKKKLCDLSVSHVNEITSCIERNNIECNTELFDIIESEGCISASMKKYKIRTNQSILNKCIAFDLNNGNMSVTINSMKTNFDFTFENIKNMMKIHINYYYSEERYTFYNTILNILKKNGYQKDEC